jgi:anaerobic magnesium-protoporphyrin IX monomethyl ester cyclase
MKVLFVWPNKDAFGFKPIGLSLLSAIARRLGWETRLFDTTEIDFGFIDNTQSGESAKIFKPVDFSPYGLQKKKIDLDSAFLKVLEEFHPDCIALSVLSDEFLIAARISSVAKQAHPEIPIIWGGKYPTLNPEKTLRMHSADFACVCEGLEAFSDFLTALSGGRDLFHIQNIWAKKDGNIIQNSIRPLKDNLDDLPYVDWEIFDKRQFYKAFNGKVYFSGDHMLNWGCPYHCTYCINHILHGLYDNKYYMRRYGVKRIIDEFKYLKAKYRLEFIKFHDEDFLMRPLDNLRELSDAYREEVNIPFVIETNPKSVTKEKVKLLKNMNCVSASLAIETGDPGLRKNLLKRVDSESDIVSAFSLLKDADIRTSSFNMLAIPFESRETYRKTVELNRKADVQYPNAGFFYPFERTELRETSVNGGFFDPEDRKTIVYDHNKPALHFPDLSEEELVEMHNVFVLYIKLPEEYESFIKRSEKLDSLGRELRTKLLEIYDNTVWKNDGWYVDDGSKSEYLKALNEIIERS